MSRLNLLPAVPIDCTGCGLCCLGQEALPVGYWLGVLAPHDPRKLPAELRAELVELRRRFDREGWPRGTACVWYDAEAKRCRHHAYRPDICIEFQLGGPDCLRIRAEGG